MKLRLGSSVVLCLASATGLASPAVVPPPAATPVDTVSDVYHGTRVADPYRWLENAADPRVEAWSDAQNVRARGYLDALAMRQPLARELTRLYTSTSPYYYGLVARGERVFAVYRDPAWQQPLIVVLNAAAEPASRRTVLDPNALDTNGLTAFDWFVPSPDGTLIAVSLSRNGSEDGTLHVYEVESGREVDAPIAHVQYATAGGSLAWTSDNRGFWYTRYPGTDRPENERHFNVQVYRHRLGADAADDPVALGRSDGLEPISEVFLLNAAGQSAVLATVARGDGGQAVHYVLRDGHAPIQLSRYEDEMVVAAQGPDGAIYAVSRKGSLNGRVVKLSPPFRRDGLRRAPTIVAEAAVSILTNRASVDGEPTVSDGRLYVRYIDGGPTTVRIFDLTGKPLGQLPLPPVAANSEIVPLRTGDLLFDVESYIAPLKYLRYHPATNQAEPTALEQSSPVSFDDTEVVREFATSRDGTKIPISIVRRKGTPLDGTSPLLLYGYGGFGISEVPKFVGPAWRLWLDAGGTYAAVGIRGGSEYGEHWHRDGMLTRKQNVFDDFAAAAEHLVATHYTARERLAMLGGSNGGLLMGALITQHPALPRAVISVVGVYDMLRVELDPNGQFNTTEFGTVRDEAQFRALLAYSPYHNVHKPIVYPAILMLTGATDGRVNPLQSRKFAAALQAASVSDRPVLLWTDKTAGHGQGSSLAKRIAERADMLAFLFDQLGMHWAPKPGP